MIAMTTTIISRHVILFPSKCPTYTQITPKTSVNITRSVGGNRSFILISLWQLPQRHFSLVMLNAKPLAGPVNYGVAGVELLSQSASAWRSYYESLMQADRGPTDAPAREANTTREARCANSAPLPIVDEVILA